jgi:hypothetical protein
MMRELSSSTQVRAIEHLDFLHNFISLKIYYFNLIEKLIRLSIARLIKLLLFFD